MFSVNPFAIAERALPAGSWKACMVTRWMGPRPAATSLMMQWLRRHVGIGRCVRCDASGSRYSLPTIFCSAGNHLDSYSSPSAFCV